MAALAYRQSLAAHKLVADPDGTPLLFSKENFSNGCIATVDVIYPAAPLLLLFSPTLLQGIARADLDYAASPRWKFPFAPHDLGTYPLANGQVYGGGERTEENQMPVEESGNMLLMVAALAQVEGNADFARALLAAADEVGGVPRRTRASTPRTSSAPTTSPATWRTTPTCRSRRSSRLGAYAKLADMRGDQADASSLPHARAGASSKRGRRWPTTADHYRLAFDKPGTWSQKYNLVWDRLLGLNLFPPEVARTEIAFYKTVQKPYGLPLDNREHYTKLDWIVWTATLADVAGRLRGAHRPGVPLPERDASRVPMTDWYWTQDGKQRGFQARSVVGGVFIRMLADPATWKKWSAAGPER